MKQNWKVLVSLHLLLLVYSTSGIFSKLASGESFLSLKFCLYYGAIIALLGIYAIGWQQIIKRMPLTVAYANKAITVVWGIVWGFLFFQERVTVQKLLGACLIIAGVVLFALSENSEAESKEDACE